MRVFTILLFPPCKGVTNNERDTLLSRLPHLLCPLPTCAGKQRLIFALHLTRLQSAHLLAAFFRSTSVAVCRSRLSDRWRSSMVMRASVASRRLLSIITRPRLFRHMQQACRRRCRSPLLQLLSQPPSLLQRQFRLRLGSERCPASWTACQSSSRR